MERAEIIVGLAAFNRGANGRDRVCFDVMDRTVSLDGSEDLVISPVEGVTITRIRLSNRAVEIGEGDSVVRGSVAQSGRPFDHSEFDAVFEGDWGALPVMFRETRTAEGHSLLTMHLPTLAEDDPLAQAIHNCLRL